MQNVYNVSNIQQHMG